MTTTKPQAPQGTAITVPDIKIKPITLRLIGDSPLIMHRWSEKAKKEMLDKQQKQAKQGKEAKNPERDYEESMYRFPDGRYAFPCVAFKASAVGACRFVDGMRMTEARGAFHVIGELVEIIGQPRMREDMVRVGMGTADLRYRAEFPEWSTELYIRFNERAISPSQIINLFNVAGFGVGVGEWRPEKDGSYGMFHVATEGE